ncbi:MAG: alpha/beta hydrolase [Candidatus Micrarchaeota archaeon]
MKKRVFIIHGWNSKPEGGWRPWLRKELEKKGYSVIIPQMPHPSLPKMGEWVKKISEEVRLSSPEKKPFPDKHCYFIGHSLGCIAILRYLETLPKSVKVGGVIIVAGFANNIGYIVFKSFYGKPINWKKIKSHCPHFIAIHSDNDKFIPLKNGTVFKQKLGAKLIVMKGAGHFSGGEGCTELPVVLEELLKIKN